MSEWRLPELVTTVTAVSEWEFAGVEFADVELVVAGLKERSSQLVGRSLKELVGRRRQDIFIF